MAAYWDITDHDDERNIIDFEQCSECDDYIHGAIHTIEERDENGSYTELAVCTDCRDRLRRKQ